ncbi:MAG TPA: hypothetical protein VI485_19445 [Vicinamibacterales bacterium]|nr:hypothetical protein [Vicinamibacterales bacterium]
MNSLNSIGLSELMLQRICGEYMEMPGLRLTLEQAQRLWGLDQDTCAQSLEFLVETRFLARIGQESYGRLTDGKVALPTLRMAKAPRDRAYVRGMGRAS